ncbi:Transcription factor WhiB [Micromonospora sediminicola]|uniref:Transcription factor WhiB n=1 Tax=Micromonospora sediminicola TaxID=946078 RepID=A0A1A9B5A5_9ACTN|nr:WhiB family transcriptional regulator [Micromonospora sediminicola]SBT64246.1 Transcription factor WhiB [Micromonospora sediminicola]
MTRLGTRSAAPDFLDDPDVVPACAGVDSALFFPTREDSAAAAETANRYCRACPVRTPCRQWALRQSPNDLYGIWGGTTREDRLRIHRRRRAGADR